MQNHILLLYSKFCDVSVRMRPSILFSTGFPNVVMMNMHIGITLLLFVEGRKDGNRNIC